eukprot:scaffold2619_cov129-Cylindrotheca_fusiformis.AAC.2
MAEGKALRFTDDSDLVYEFERLTLEEMDDVFYSEEEIGEMRNYAFLIECGLEEEDWSGPDVPPLPWPKDAVPVPSHPADSSIELTRKPPHWDDTDYNSDLEEEDLKDPASPKTPTSRKQKSGDVLSPNRKLMATKSADLEHMRTNAHSPIRGSPRRQKLMRTMSVSMGTKRLELRNVDKGTTFDEENTNSPGEERRRLMRTKSGSSGKNGLKRVESHRKKESGRKQPSSKAGLSASSSLPEKGKSKQNDSKKQLDRSAHSTVSSSSSGLDSSILSGLDLGSHGSDRSIDSDIESDDDSDSDDDDAMRDFLRYMERREPKQESGVKAYTVYGSDGKLVGTALPSG